MNVITRKQYMDNYPGEGTKDEQRAAHRAYYAQFVNEQTIATVVRHIGAGFIESSTDEHFNDIPLRRWDTLVALLPLAIDPREVGDLWSLGTAVCVAKEAAQQWKEKNK